jgi:hypothetical protein
MTVFYVPYSFESGLCFSFVNSRIGESFMGNRLSDRVHYQMFDDCRIESIRKSCAGVVRTLRYGHYRPTAHYYGTALREEGEYKATWKREFNLPWRKADPLKLSR